MVNKITRGKLNKLPKNTLLQLFIFTCGILSTTKGFTDMHPGQVIDWVLAAWESADSKSEDIKRN